MKIITDYSLNRNQRRAIARLEKYLKEKIIPIMEGVELPPLELQQYCCPIHTFHFQLYKSEKQETQDSEQSEFNQHMDDMHKRLGIH